MKTKHTPSELPHHVRRTAPFAAIAAIAMTLYAAAESGENPAAAPTATGREARKQRSELTGEQLFHRTFPGANNRSCATCHVPEDNFALTPAHVERKFKENPNGPLFNAIDADDPTAKKLTFKHLRKGLIRVGLKLHPKMDLIDDDGKVITPKNREITVWRSVPSIADSALTAPYQLDGRMTTLEAQAQGAVTGHSQGGKTPAIELKRIANFERGIFSSDRSRAVAKSLANGVSPEDIPDAEDRLQLVMTPAERRGQVVYNNVCASCHGGHNKATIMDREVHALNFAALKPDGTIRWVVPATEPQTPVYVPQPNNEFINIGSAFWNYMTQNDLADDNPSFVRNVSFPKYRFRFYKDASKKEIIADLPPRVGYDPENPLAPPLDSDGNFIVGPNQFPQRYTADPGRAAITGNPYDFEAFDIPTLRGISKTAPYWHNNISATLEEVVELYSDQLLSRFPLLVQPGEKEHGDGPGPQESMTRQQKDDLVKYLKRL
jgi:cytochrome c peroxidase